MNAFMIHGFDPYEEMRRSSFSLKATFLTMSSTNTGLS